MANYEFFADRITCNGSTFPAEYSISPTRTVFVFARVPEKPEPVRIRISPEDELYTAALAAAEDSRHGTPPQQERPTPPEPIQEPAQEERRENISEAARPVPEKSFIGSTIQGKGWRILFDGEAGRTRILFDAQPTAKAKKAVEMAGFYFSALHNSWNKKLTWKAYRAAQELTGKLNKIYA